MTRPCLITSVVFMIFWCHVSLDASWLSRKAEGWAWHESPPKQEESAPEEVQPEQQATSRLAEARAELEEALSLAILEPDEENVAQYMRLQKKWVDQSAGFAQTWQRVLLGNPLLDETVGNPTSQIGSQVSKEQRRRERESLIQKLTHTYGLLFLYEGGSLESQAMAQVVALLHERYKWDYLPVSVDGKHLSVFENSYPMNDLVSELGVTTFPSLFLLDPESRQVIPVGFGVLALEQVERNIQIQFYKEGQ